MPRRNQRKRKVLPTITLPPRPPPPPKPDYFLELKEKLEAAERLKAAFLEWKRKRNEAHLARVAAEERRQARLALMNKPLPQLAPPKPLPPPPPPLSAHTNWAFLSRRAKAYAIEKGVSADMLNNRMEFERTARQN